MKKLLSILLLSISLIGCSKLSKSFYNGFNKLASVVTLEERVLYDELTNKGTGEKPIMYFEGALFNGVGFGVYPDGQLQYENRFKNGVLDGLARSWRRNGQSESEANFKDGERVVTDLEKEMEMEAILNEEIHNAMPDFKVIKKEVLDKRTN